MNLDIRLGIRLIEDPMIVRLCFSIKHFYKQKNLTKSKLAQYSKEQDIEKNIKLLLITFPKKAFNGCDYLHCTIEKANFREVKKLPPHKYTNKNKQAIQ